jgi:Ca2+-binding EF-hand superfamily protein
MEKILEKTLSSDEMIEKARRFAFNVYDINCDGYVDTIDLFSFIKD